MYCWNKPGPGIVYVQLEYTVPGIMYVQLEYTCTWYYVCTTGIYLYLLLCMYCWNIPVPGTGYVQLGSLIEF